MESSAHNLINSIPFFCKYPTKDRICNRKVIRTLLYVTLYLYNKSPHFFISQINILQDYLSICLIDALQGDARNLKQINYFVNDPYILCVCVFYILMKMGETDIKSTCFLQIECNVVSNVKKQQKKMKRNSDKQRMRE